MKYEAKSTPRREDARLTTGQGRFVANIGAEGELHAAFYRSSEARGVIRSVEVESAAAMPGVVTVLTGTDLDVPGIPAEVSPDGAAEGAMSRPILATDRVQHVGEAIAMVIAESPAAAVDALEAVWADLEPLPAVVDPATAAAAEPIHADTITNVVETGAIGDATAGWDHEIDIEVTVANQRLAPVTLEPLSALAVPKAGGVRLTVGHQGPHLLKRQLGALLPFDIEVVVPDVGGGFGTKGRIYPEYVAIVAAAHRLGRPVRWLQTRSEQLACGCHGRDMIHTVRMAGDRSGRIRRAHVDFLLAVGAYPHVGAMIAHFTKLVAQGLYDIADFTVSFTTVVNNTAPIAPYRGAGRPEAAYAIERAVDAFSRAVDLEPLDVRRMNVLAHDGFPHRTATGALYDSGNYELAIEKAADQLDIPSFRAEQAERLVAGDPLLGLGIGAYIERSGGAPDTAEYAKVELTGTGELVVYTGSVSNGQGHETVWAQVAGQLFDVGVGQVTVIAGDTVLVPRGTGTNASRSAQIGASGVWRCATRLRETTDDIAAELLEASIDDLRLEGGIYHVAGVPTRTVELVDVAARAAEIGIALSDEEWYSPGVQCFPYGVHAAIVEVDPETGFVEMLRYVAIEDCGNVLHPVIVEGQTHGSVAQGIGQALFEGVQYSPDGQLLTGSLLDYTIPCISDVAPVIDTDRVVTPAPSNPLGVKGSGEGGCIGAPPAVVNAVLDALAPLGVDHLDMPLYPEKVWQAIETARRST